MLDHIQLSFVYSTSTYQFAAVDILLHIIIHDGQCVKLTYM